MRKGRHLAGLSHTKERNSPKSALDGWRRSADRAGLHGNSLLTGNFTGNSAIYGPQERADWLKVPALQRLFENSLRRLTGNVT